MEYIKKEELIEGEIYKNTGNNIIFKCINDKTPLGIGFRIISKRFVRNNWFSSNPEYLLATPEEKHWLNCCITADKFITFEEAMKTFIPEYVEAISNKHSSSEIIGTVYKTSELPKWVQGHKLEEYWKACIFHYKPSTKEAYDAQFVVKEPEFVLPEKWCILRTGNNYNIINKWFQDNNLGKPYMNYGYIWKSNNNYYTYLTKPEHRTEITFEQFKKYVLKEEIVEEKVIEPLPQFKIIETIETITKVENNEGNQFFIGDEVIGSKTKIKSKIISFKYNVDKTAILAITDKTPNIGIGINHLEHYIEPKVEVEETLLEKAKRLYPVGTKVKTITGNDFEIIIKDQSKFKLDSDNNIFTYEEYMIYLYNNDNNKWATIIE